MRRFPFFLVLAIFVIGFGCSTGLRPGPARRPQRRIDWRDPVSVTRGFLSAKTRGDWQTAYRCCDYDETLPRAEKDRVKKKWREECKRWPFDYADTRWYVTGCRYDGDIAAVKIAVLNRDTDTRRLKPGLTYEEKLKKYKDKWKITNLFAGEASE